MLLRGGRLVHPTTYIVALLNLKASSFVTGDAWRVQSQRMCTVILWSTPRRPRASPESCLRDTNPHRPQLISVRMRGPDQQRAYQLNLRRSRGPRRASATNIHLPSIRRFQRYVSRRRFAVVSAAPETRVARQRKYLSMSCQV